MRLILHIGQHKTGSKALQNALYADTARLHQAGYDYPLEAPPGAPLRAWERNHHALFSLARVCADALATETHDAQRALIQHLRTLVLRTPARTHSIIVSSEDLFDMHTAHELAFEPARVALGAKALARASRVLELETRVVCYLRRQDHALAARYAQFIKGSQNHTARLATYAARTCMRLDYDWLVRCWEEAFSADVISLRRLEPGYPSNGVVEDFYSHILSLTAPCAISGAQPDLEVSNISPSRRQILFMRMLNARSQRTQAVLARDRVLSAADEEPSGYPRGAEAWLSGGARAQLLSRHAAGNARLATRHFADTPLFCEPPPGILSPVPAPESLSLDTLLALERAARAVTPSLPSRGVIVWLTSGKDYSRDEALAADLLAGLIGDPHHASVVWVRGASHHLQWSRMRLFVAVGLEECSRIDWRMRARLTFHRVPLLLCVGEIPPMFSPSSRLRSVLRQSAKVLCASDHIREQLQGLLPAAPKMARKISTLPLGSRASVLLEVLCRHRPLYT